MSDATVADLTGAKAPEPAVAARTAPLARPTRSAWIEVDLGKLARNFQLINRDKPSSVQVLSVVKDDAYGHGALQVARTAVENGASFLALSSLDEAMNLRQKGIRSPMLLLGERQEAELPWCVKYRLT